MENTFLPAHLVDITSFPLSEEIRRARTMVRLSPGEESFSHPQAHWSWDCLRGHRNEANADQPERAANRRQPLRPERIR
jgi:hypothetical protein